MHISIGHIMTLAKNAFMESIRDRVLQIILVFSVVFIAYALFEGTVSLGEDVHVIRTLGLAGIYILGLVTTIFLGSSLIYREFERRTLYFVLSKPVAREEVLLGKYVGLLASISLGILGMTAVYLAVVAFAGGGFDAGALVVVLFELMEMAILTAIAILFSTFAGPLSSVLYSIVAVYIGHSLSQLWYLGRTAGPVAEVFYKVSYFLLPNLEKFNIRDAAVYGTLPGPAAIAVAFGYAVVYVVILLYASLLIFRHREL